MSGSQSGAGSQEAEQTRIVEEAEAKQLPALIAEWWDAPDHRRWIARALRIDLALLTERPELVVPCLHRRCAWPGAPRETAFYAGRPDPPAGVAALRESVRHWRPGTPWLCSLRPPPVPLDAGVVEEYRTGLAGALAFSADGASIGVAGEQGAVGWNRPTGRRLTSPAQTLGAAPSAPRWRMDRGSSWGSLIFAGEARRIAFELSEDEIARDWWPIEPDLAVVDLDDIDMDHRFALLDLARGDVVWRSPGRCRAVAAMPGRGAIVLGTDAGIEVRDLGTGQVRASWPAPAVDAVAAAPDELVAARSGSVIRVWDPEIAAVRACRLQGTEGWTAAELSVDGARLVTGSLLCNGWTGAFVARLPTNSPEGWLEGGPPRRCRRLTTTAFVEIMPQGLRLWDAVDGARAVDDPKRGARYPDLVAFDAIGRHHAIAHERGWLRVYRLRGGELMYGRDGVKVESLGFSPGGERLWWVTSAGERWVLELPPPGAGGALAPRRLSDGEALPAEPAPVEVAVADGLLSAGAAAIPCDDPAAIASRDGRTFASRTSHYALEER